MRGFDLEPLQAPAKLFLGKTVIHQESGIAMLDQGGVTPAAATQ